MALVQRHWKLALTNALLLLLLAGAVTYYFVQAAAGQVQSSERASEPASSQAPSGSAKPSPRRAPQPVTFDPQKVVVSLLDPASGRDVAKTAKQAAASVTSTVDPGRIHNVKAPGPDVPALGAVGSQYREVKRNADVELAVKGVAGAPVTFTSFDFGTFDNGFSSVTVKADAKGRASATLHLNRGTYGGLTVVAGSPETSGQVVFALEVIDETPEGGPLPNELPDEPTPAGAERPSRAAE